MSEEGNGKGDTNLTSENTKCALSPKTNSEKVSEVDGVKEVSGSAASAGSGEEDGKQETESEGLSKRARKRIKKHEQWLKLKAERR